MCVTQHTANLPGKCRYPKTLTPTLTGLVQAEEGPGLMDSGLVMM